MIRQQGIFIIEGGVRLVARQILNRCFTAGTLFNLSFLIYAVLVPLEAVQHGIPLWEVGILTASPGFLQLPALVLSGPLSDVFGEPLMIRVTFVMAMAAGLFVLLVHPLLLGLVLGQLSIGIARGLYWASAQSLVSRQPGDRARAMGLFTTFNKGGALLGIFSAGLAASVFGIFASFRISVALALAALVVFWPIPAKKPNRETPPLKIALAGMWPAAKDSMVMLYGLVAFVCAMPQALAQSFYPVYLLQLNPDKTLVGAVTALMGLGMTVSAPISSTVFNRMGIGRTVTLSSLMVVAGFLITPVHSIWVSGLGIFAAGWAAGWLNVAFLTRISAASQPNRRATNLAMTQLYFGTSMMVTPVLTGWASAAMGFWAGFALPAFLALGLTLLYLVFARRDQNRRVVDAVV